MIRTMALILCCLLPLHAEENKVSPKGIPPVIPPELEIRYLRAVVENQVVQMQARAAESKQKLVADEIVGICGKDFVPQDDEKTKSRLVCVAKQPKP
jgi:hypothetical protein